jgi:16S rRNA processing protein RimM
VTDVQTQPVILGRIVGLFGVRGWIKVYSYTEPREAVLDYKDWLLGRDGNWQRARLEGIADRDAATELIGSDIGVDRDALPDPEEGHYYWADLEGLTVVQRNGTELGKVAYLMATGANDVLVVDGPTERLIPFVSGTVILDVDFAAGVIHVDWEWD